MHRRPYASVSSPVSHTPSPPRRGRARTLATILAAVLALTGVSAVAAAARSGTANPKAAGPRLAPVGPTVSIGSGGPLTDITITTDLNCAVQHTGDSSGEWYGGTACGTLVSAAGTLYGPAYIPAGGGATGALGYTAFTPVSQTGPTGTGTSGDPLKVVTVVALGTSGLKVTETDSYVIGQETYRTDVQLAKTGGTPVPVIIYRAGDCFLQDSDYGLGVVSGSTVTCKALPGSPNPDRIEQLLPLTGGSHYYEAGYNEVWERIGSQLAFPDTCACADQIDNGEGLSWSSTLAAGAATTVSNLTVFSPVGAEPQQVTKTADIASVNQGASDGYTITVENPGAVPATLSSISDTLPAGFTYTPGSSSGATTTDPSVNASTLTWSGPFTVPAANANPGSISLHFNVTVSSISGTYLNSATGAGQGLTVIGSGPTAPVHVGGIVDHPTTCVVTGLRAGPPAQQDVTVNDADGIAAIYGVHVINGTVYVTPFTPGTPGPVLLTATKTIQSQRTFWEFDVRDSKGHTKHCV
jgi:uncharacterized repeat protein (TIGR01451 family)